MFASFVNTRSDGWRGARLSILAVPMLYRVEADKIVLNADVGRVAAAVTTQVEAQYADINGSCYADGPNDARHVAGVSLTAFSSGGLIVKIRGSFANRCTR